MLPDNEEFLARFAEQYQSCWPRSAPAHRKLTLWRKTGSAQTTRRPMHRTRVRPPAAPWPRWSWPPSASACPEICPYTPKLLAATFMGSFDKDPARPLPPPCWTAETTPS